jgi:hypothetical protein
MISHKLCRRFVPVVVLLGLLLSACGSRMIVDESNEDTGLFTSMLVDGADNPIIAYFDKKERTVKLALCDDPLCNEFEIKVIDDEGAVGQYPSLVLDEQGFPVISYYDMTKKALKIAVCQDARCDAIERKILDQTGKAGEYNSLQLTSAGCPVISYFDDENEHLKLAICGDPACADVLLTTVDDGEDVGKSTSLALTADDRAVISYYDEENAYLKLAVCNDAECSDPVLRTFVSGEADAGEYNSIALLDNGHPIIAYNEVLESGAVSSGALKLINCMDPLCEGATTTTVDESRTGEVGAHNSMVLNSDGYPVIAYWHGPGRGVRIAACRDEACNRRSIRKSGFDWGGQHISVALNSKGRIYFSIYETRPAQNRLVLYRPRFP